MIAVHPRAYGRAESVRDPALVVHQLAAKPRAWGESEIRADFPDVVRRWFDERDPDDLAASLKAVSAACRDCSFDAVAKAAAASSRQASPSACTPTRSHPTPAGSTRNRTRTTRTNPT